ncbi:Uncharacterized protein OBRU01_26605, partial [Operophtera brumata]
ISFPVSTKVHLSCGQDLYKTLQGSYLAVIPQNCFLETPEFTISNTNDRLKGQALNLKIIDLPSDDFVTSSSAPAFKLNSINLNHLHGTNKEISLQSPLPLRSNIDYGLYHTTIPMYVIAKLNYKEFTPFRLQKGLIPLNPQLNLRQASILAVLRVEVLRKANV